MRRRPNQLTIDYVMTLEKARVTKGGQRWASLSAHLRQPEQHARLPFHPECPICRDERLVGTLAPAALVPARGRAAVAAGVLALSAVAPPATLAQEPDQTREGVAAPDAPAGDGIHGTDFDPGGATIELPDDPTPPLLAGPADDAADADGPVELEPETDTAAPIVDAGEQAAGAGTPTNPPEGAPQQPVESPAAPEAPTPAPAPTPPAAQTPGTAPSPSAEDAGERTRANSAAADERQAGSTRASNAGVGADPAVAAVHDPVGAARDRAGCGSRRWWRQSWRARRCSRARRRRSSRARRARLAIGSPGASAYTSCARASRCGRSRPTGSGARRAWRAIAREVNRLWELNRERIGTGDPDLLMVGTRLMLR